MASNGAARFWKRFSVLCQKDLPVLLKTGIPQSTLSTWRKAGLYPRANEAAAIAAALNTTVEFLVNGKDTQNTACTPPP